MVPDLEMALIGKQKIFLYFNENCNNQWNIERNKKLIKSNQNVKKHYSRF